MNRATLLAEGTACGGVALFGLVWIGPFNLGVPDEQENKLRKRNLDASVRQSFV